MKNKMMKLVTCALSAIMVLSTASCGSKIATRPVTQPEVYTVNVTDGFGGGSFYADSEVTLLADTATDERFDGWYNGDTLLSADEEYTFKATANLDVKAMYSAKYANIEIIGGGYETETGLSSLKVVRGEEITVEAKEDQNKQFDKFVVNGADVTADPYVFTADEDLVITTVYQNTYMVYAKNGTINSASINSSVTANPGDTLTITYVEAEGETLSFAGWYNQNNQLVSDQESFDFVVEETTYLYAKIGVDVNVVFSYYDLDGTLYDVLDKVYTEGQNVVAPTSPSIVGYEFAGWFAEAVGGTEITDFGKATTDVTYFAQFNDVRTPLDLPTYVTADGIYNLNGSVELLRFFDDAGKKATLFTITNVSAVVIYVYASQTADMDDYVASITITVDLASDTNNNGNDIPTLIFKGVGDKADATVTVKSNWAEDGANLYMPLATFTSSINAVVPDITAGTSYYFAFQMVTEHALYKESAYSVMSSVAYTC